MSCIVPRAFILRLHVFIDAKDKGSHLTFCYTVVKRSQRMTKFARFVFKFVDIHFM